MRILLRLFKAVLLMVLPPFNTMLPNVLAKIEEQVWQEGEEPHTSGLLVPVSI